MQQDFYRVAYNTTMITPDNYLFTTKHGCGRYTLINSKKMKKRFDVSGTIPEIKPNYNTSPTQTMPIVVHKDGKNQLLMSIWGLLPIWAVSNPNFGYKTFNARAENLEESKLWSKPFHETRCLVPAEGYYEWKKLGGKDKQPYYFHLQAKEMFAFAGLYNTWTDKKTDEIRSSFTIVTTDANKAQAPIHDRMPVILDKGEEGVWLDETETPAHLAAMLNPYKTAGFELYPVDKAVGNSRNNYAELLDKVADQ